VTLTEYNPAQFLRGEATRAELPFDRPEGVRGRPTDQDSVK